MGNIAGQNGTNNIATKVGFQTDAKMVLRAPLNQQHFEKQCQPKTPQNGFKIYQIPSHIVEAVEFPEIEKMKEDVPDYEMFQPGQVYDDSFDDENDTVALIDDDYIGQGFFIGIGIEILALLVKTRVKQTKKSIKQMFKSQIVTKSSLIHPNHLLYHLIFLTQI